MRTDGAADSTAVRWLRPLFPPSLTSCRPAGGGADDGASTLEWDNSSRRVDRRWAAAALHCCCCSAPLFPAVSPRLTVRVPNQHHAHSHAVLLTNDIDIAFRSLCPCAGGRLFDEKRKNKEKKSEKRQPARSASRSLRQHLLRSAPVTATRCSVVFRLQPAVRSRRGGTKGGRGRRWRRGTAGIGHRVTAPAQQPLATPPLARFYHHSSPVRFAHLRNSRTVDSLSQTQPPLSMRLLTAVCVVALVACLAVASVEASVSHREQHKADDAAALRDYPSATSASPSFCCRWR